VRAAIERRLEGQQRTADETIATILDAAADVLGLTGACWHHTDPESGLPIASAVLGDPAGSLEWSLTYEYRRPDVSRFDELRGRRLPVAAISTETGGAPRDSARFREMVEPAGPADEVRVAFVDRFGFWAGLVMFTDRRMTEQDLRFVADLVAPATATLRGAVAAAARVSAGPAAPEPPSVLVLDRDDNVVSADAIARRRLALLPEPRAVELPGVISFIAAQARWAEPGRAARARMRGDDGRWLLVDASLLEGRDAGDVAIVIQDAPAASVLDGALRAFGLSDREREIAALVLRGYTAKAIASSLVISPWTVQDHVKAIYEKTGAAGRAELLGLVPLPAA
jgi:DNA-binding CsgD family transcriptional regulator